MKRPTVEECKAYMVEKGRPAEMGEAFHDYYEMTGWATGRAGKPMKCWKAGCRNWIRNQKKWNPEQTKPKAHRYVDQLDIYADPEPPSMYGAAREGLQGMKDALRLKH